MDFTQAYNQSGLADALALDKITFTQEAADLLVTVVKLEPISFPLLAVTFRSEASPPFNIHTLPNVNGHPEDPDHWDIGPGQPDRIWYRKLVAAKQIEALPEDQVFGTVFYEGAQASLPASPAAIEKQAGMPALLRTPEGGTPNPCAFTGDPVYNLRATARWLLSIHAGSFAEFGYLSEDEMRACLYTGEPHRPRRSQIYRALEGPLRRFFDLYTAQGASVVSGQ
jgi:hypothetical protein